MLLYFCDPPFELMEISTFYLAMLTQVHIRLQSRAGPKLNFCLFSPNPDS